MTPRVFSIAAIAVLAALEQGCADACDTYASAWEEKLTECGIEIPAPAEGEEEAPEPPCTDAQVTQAECLSECLPESCGALDGTDGEAVTAYGKCVDACPQAGL